MIINILITILILIPINFYIFYKLRMGSNEKSFVKIIDKLDLKKIIIFNLSYIILAIIFTIFLKFKFDVFTYTSLIFIFFLKYYGVRNKNFFKNFDEVLEYYFIIIFIIISIIDMIYRWI